MKVMVFDVGGTEIKYSVMDEQMNRFDAGSVPTPQDTQQSSAAADLSGGLAAVPGVQKDPRKVDDDGNNTQCYYNFEVQTA